MVVYREVIAMLISPLGVTAQSAMETLNEYWVISIAKVKIQNGSVIIAVDLIRPKWSFWKFVELFYINTFMLVMLAVYTLN